MTTRALITLLLAIGIAATAAAEPIATKPEFPTLSEDQLEKIHAGQVVVYASKEDPQSSIATATGIVEIETTEEEIWDILTSEFHSENASKAMKDCTIVSDKRLGPNLRRLVVTYLMKVGPQDIQWTVTRDVHEGGGLLAFEIDDSFDNDIAWTAGYYALFPGQTDDHVIIVYVSNLDTGRNIPQWIEDDLTQGSLKKYLKYLKSAAEED